MTDVKGLVNIGSSHPKISKKERIFRLIKDSGKQGITAGQIKKVTGLLQGTVGSSLAALQKEKKVHTRKVAGGKIKIYYPGDVGSFSPNIVQIKKMIRDLDTQAQELRRKLSEATSSLVFLEKTIHTHEEREFKLKEELKNEKEKYKKLEEEHLTWMQKLEGMLK